MGFGLLFVGYFFANVMALYSPLSFAMLAGYPLMILGLFRLAPYHKRFRFAFDLSLFSLPLALYFSIYGLLQMGLLGSLAPLFKGPLYGTMEWCYFAFTFFFNLAVLYGVAGLNAELELVSLQGGAWRNLILVAVYYVADLVVRMPVAAAVRGYLVLPVLLLRLIFVFLNLYLFYRCYRLICPEGEENIAPIRLPDKPREKGEEEK